MKRAIIFLCVIILCACSTEPSGEAIETAIPQTGTAKLTNTSKPTDTAPPTNTNIPIHTDTPEPPDLAKFGDIYKACPASSTVKLEPGVTFGVLSDVAHECYGEVGPEVSKEEGLLSHLKIIYKAFDGTTMPERGAVIDQEVEIYINPSLENQALLGIEVEPTPEGYVGQKYNVEIGVESNSSKVWMPVPRYWDGNGVQSISINEISPEPDDWYRDDTGTEILYWQNYSGKKQVYKVKFDVVLAHANLFIDSQENISSYDKNTYLYNKFTSSDNLIQADADEIITQALSIIGNETNPYRQARLIHKWMTKNISYEPGQRDAISVLRNKHCACGGRAFLFVALCRSIGIPARTVAGIHTPGSDNITSGNWPDRTMGYHIWAEFYLPEHGWVQVDPDDVKKFDSIDEARLITSKGNHIKLGHGSRHNEISWFHIPYDTNNQIEDSPLWIEAEKIP